MTPRSSSLRTRSAAEGAERPSRWPSSAQVARPLRMRIFRVFISKDFIDTSLRNDGIDIVFPSIHKYAKNKETGIEWTRILSQPETRIPPSRCQPGDVRAAGKRERAATI